MAIRGVHTADLHFGVSTFSKETPDGLGSRVHDFFKTFDQIVEFIKANDIDILLITGDIFKDREPNSTLRNLFYKRIIDISSFGTNVVIIPGNHDMHPFEYKDHPVKVFEIFNKENIFVMDKLFDQKIIEIKKEKLRIISVPYPYHERFIANADDMSIEKVELDFQNWFEKNLSNKLEQIDDDIPTILAGHFSVNEADAGSERGIMLGKDIKIPLSNLMNPKITYVALGHIHKPQILNPKNPTIAYCGSPDRIDFSEMSDIKGFVYFEISDEFKFYYHPLHVRPFYMIELDVKDSPNMMDNLVFELQKKIDMIEDKYPNSFRSAIVKVLLKVNRFVKQKVDVSIIEKYLETRCFIVGPIEFEIEDDKRDFRMAAIDEKSDPVDAFAKYLHVHQRYSDIKNKDEIIKVFKQIYDSLTDTLI